MNAFAVQVLAAAAGDPSRFRSAEREAGAVTEIERDKLGFPLGWKERWAHSIARTDFMETMSAEMPDKEWIALVKKYDEEDPGYFVEWHRRKQEERAAVEARRRGAA
jgi:hypothetical protein